MVAAAPQIKFIGDRLSVHFGRFDIPSYHRFLQVKALPESDIQYDRDTATYTVTAPKRFAVMLGEKIPAGPTTELALSSFLFDDQHAITSMALDAKRFAVWSDCGLGKTLISLEFARHVIHRTGGRVLIVTLNDIVDQFADECRAFYGQSLPIVRIKSRAEMRLWCLDGTIGRSTSRTEEREKHFLLFPCPSSSRGLAEIEKFKDALSAGDHLLRWDRWAEFSIRLSTGETVDVLWDPTSHDGHLEFHGPISETGYRSHFTQPITDATLPEFAAEFAESLSFKIRNPKSNSAVPTPPRLAITNYEKFNPEDGQVGNQIITELRSLAGLILDESSRLKTGGGKQKWAIIKSSRGIEYKLSATATPAPNDTMEFASQASFLERMRSEGEIIWTYFHRDSKTHRWKVKEHAREAFFRFMSSWSIYVRDPRKYGWRLDHQPVPEPVTKIVEVAATSEQLQAMRRFQTDPNGQMRMFEKDNTNAIERMKLSEIAKGFVYYEVTGENGKTRRRVERILSLKPNVVADLVAAERARGANVLVWTQFDAETAILEEALQARGLTADVVTGKVPKSEQPPILERFRRGESPLLIGRAKMIGYGQNFQKCQAMIFSGWNDSFEEFYQAVRRAVRHGQTEIVRVYIPVIRELEGDMLDNIQGKEAKHLAAIELQEANYVKALQ